MSIEIKEYEGFMPKTKKKDSKIEDKEDKKKAIKKNKSAKNK